MICGNHAFPYNQDIFFFYVCGFYYEDNICIIQLFLFTCSHNFFIVIYKYRSQVLYCTTYIVMICRVHLKRYITIPRYSTPRQHLVYANTRNRITCICKLCLTRKHERVNVASKCAIFIEELKVETNMIQQCIL